jgi:hypothetical protein
MNWIALFAAAALAAGCAGFDGRGLVPGKSTFAEVDALMGPAADKRPGTGGETVYYYSRLPHGYAMYAARIAPDGTLVALEQRLTEENTRRIKLDATRSEEVLDLLGPPWNPMKMPLKDELIWTYPMRVPGYLREQWFLVHFSLPGEVAVQKYFLDDPKTLQPDTPTRE